MSDTRKDKRAPVSLKVRFKSATVDEFMEQYARDISRGGLFIKSKSPMPVGTLLKFEVQLRDESPVIRGVGRVVWKREPTEAVGNDAPSGMGIKFIRMDAECRAFVEKIVTQRGDVPGQFEAGGSPAREAPESAPPPPPVAPVAPVTKSNRPRQVTAPFFPASGPSDSEMPLPEDRTQVRHASEFLASALAEAGDSEAAREAERKAEEARQRSEEIERERAQRARESERPHVSNDVPPQPSEPPAAVAEQELGTEAKHEHKLEIIPEPEAPQPEAEAPSDKREPSKRIPVAARDLVDHRPPPVEEPNSYLIPAILGIAALAVVGYFAFSLRGNHTELPTPPPVAQPSEPSPDEPRDEVPELTPEATEAPSEAAEIAAQEPTATPVPTVHLRIETAPPGATISIDDTERGLSPVDIEAPLGAALVVSAHLAGHRVATQEVTPREPTRPIRMQLAPLPYAVEVTTTPPGARVRVAGRTATATSAGGRITIPRPSGPVPVLASLAGHLDASQNVSVDSFVERNGEMVASIALTLRERPAPVRPPPVIATPRRPEASEATPAPSAAEPEVERPREEPAAPAPEPTEERPRRPQADENETPPENPF